MTDKELRAAIAHEVARQLATDPEPTWLIRTRIALSWVAIVSLAVLAVLAVSGVLR